MFQENKLKNLPNNLAQLRGYLDERTFLPGLFLLKKTWGAIKETSLELKDRNPYFIMRDIASRHGLPNVFTDERVFNRLFEAFDDSVDWQSLLGTTNFRSGGINYISESTASKFRSYIEGDQNQAVLIAEGEKFAFFLNELVKPNDKCNFVITSQNSLYCDILQEIFAGQDNVKVINTSIYQYEFMADKFDLILSVPVFGSRVLVDESQSFLCREYEMVATENLLLHLSRNGRLVIVLPAKITFASGRVKELRQFIQQMYKIEEISELPTGIFQFTGIKTYLFSIAAGKTDDITIRKYEITNGDEKKIELKDETFVMDSELEDLGDWNIDKIFATQDEDWQKYQNSNIKKIALGEIAEVFRGKVVNRKDENGKIGVINISNLKEYNIDYGGIDHLEEDERKVSNYLLKDDDVLLPARGTAIRTAVFEEQVYPCIASSNVIVIRPQKNQLSGRYLKIFFDSEIGAKLIKAMQQGTTVINISYKDLANIEIPVLSLEEQQKISDEYKNELRIYQETIFNAEEKWQTVIKKLQERF